VPRGGAPSGLGRVGKAMGGGCCVSSKIVRLMADMRRIEAQYDHCSIYIIKVMVSV